MPPNYETPIGFRKIPRADGRYVVAGNGKVFNLKTGKMLKQQWNGHKLYTVIKDPKGRQFMFDESKLDDPQYTPLTKDWVLKKERAKVIPKYPDYAVSHYGAVYRITPKSTGPRAGEVFMVKEYTIKGFPYVSLRLENGKRKLVRLDLLTERVWGGESTYI